MSNASKTPAMTEPCTWCGRPKDDKPGACPSHCQVCDGCHASGTYCSYPADDYRSGTFPGTWA